MLQIQEININDIVVSSTNTRKDLQANNDEINIDDLAHSIQEFGLLNPLIVSKKENNYEVIAGQRRFLACKKLNIEKIPCIIKNNLDTQEAITISLIENIQRADMSPIDKSRAYKNLLDKLKDVQILSNYVGVSVPTIRRYLSLLDLSNVLQERVDSREGTLGVEALSKIAKTYDNPIEQEQVYDKIKGFNQKVQIEIIKQTKGDVQKLDEIVFDAQAGIFDTSVCTRGLCDLIPPEFEEKLKDELQQRKKLTWLELFTRVATTTMTGVDIAGFFDE